MAASEDGVWAAAFASGALIAQTVAGKATRDTLFLTHFGIQMLPAAMIGAAVVSLVAVLGLSRVLAKKGPARVVPASFALGGTLFMLELWLSQRDVKAATLAVYLHTAIFGAAGISAFWSLVNERFDPQTAKRVVGRIASGGTAGGVLGGLLVWQASSRLTVPQMLILLAAINVVGFVAAVQMLPKAKPGAKVTPEAPFEGGGVAALKETPYLRDLATLVAVGAVSQAFLDWLLSYQATNEWGKGPKLLAFFALYNVVIGVLSFLAQTTLSRPALEKLGLAGTIKLSPIAVVGGAAIALVAPHWTTITLLRGGDQVVRNSVYRGAYELFYTPLPNAKKRAAKTLVDVGFDRMGTMVGSGALLAVAHLGASYESRIVLFAVVGLAVIAWLLAARLHDGYVATLASALKTGAVTLEDDDLADLTTKKTLAETTALLDRDNLLARIEKLQKEKAARQAEPAPAKPSDPRLPVEVPVSVRSLDDAIAARVSTFRSRDNARIKTELAVSIPTSLAPFVIPLLAEDAVVRDAVRCLRKIAPRITGMLVDALLDPETDMRVRRRLPRVLKVCRTQRAASGMLLALSDPVFEVREQVGLGLTQLVEEAELKFDLEEVIAIVKTELDAGQKDWAGELPRGLAHIFIVLGLVLDREPLAIAFRATRSEDSSLRGTALEYLEVVLPPRIREGIVPLLGEIERAPKTRERASTELADELLRSAARSGNRL